MLYPKSIIPDLGQKKKSHMDPEYKALPFRPLRGGLVKRNQAYTFFSIGDRRRPVPRSKHEMVVSVWKPLRNMSTCFSKPFKEFIAEVLWHMLHNPKMR